MISNHDTIDPTILQTERQFRVGQRKGLDLTVLVDDSGEEGGSDSRDEIDELDQRCHEDESGVFEKNSY